MRFKLISTYKPTAVKASVAVIFEQPQLRNLNPKVDIVRIANDANGVSRIEPLMDNPVSKCDGGSQSRNRIDSRHLIYLLSGIRTSVAGDALYIRIQLENGSQIFWKVGAINFLHILTIPDPTASSTHQQDEVYFSGNNGVSVTHGLVLRGGATIQSNMLSFVYDSVTHEYFGIFDRVDVTPSSAMFDTSIQVFDSTNLVDSSGAFKVIA